ncbi:MAG: LexA family transcriptional regulator [Pseudomonadota bacterium]
MHDRHEIREEQRREVRTYVEELGITPTELARMAGIAPSTLNRFLNLNVDHLLSMTTMSKISGVHSAEMERRFKERNPHLYSKKTVEESKKLDSKLNTRFPPDAVKNLVAYSKLERLDFGSDDPAAALKVFFRGELPVDELPVLGNSDGIEDGFSLKEGLVQAYVPRPSFLSKTSSAYAIYMNGTSMEPRYYAGEILYVNPSKPPRTSDFVLLTDQNDHGSVRQLVSRTSGRVVVRQWNPVKEAEIASSDVKYLHVVVGSFTYGH